MMRLKKKTAQSGMTLLEVMVVVAIVALIAVISYPVFGKVRESSRMARSASALRQIHIGMTMYSQEYDAKASAGKASDMGLPLWEQWVLSQPDQGHVPQELWYEVYNSRALEYLNDKPVPSEYKARFNYLPNDTEQWKESVEFWRDSTIYIYDWTIPKQHEYENPAYLQTYQVLRIDGSVSVVRIYDTVSRCQSPRSFEAFPNICGGLR